MDKLCIIQAYVRDANRKYFLKKDVVSFVLAILRRAATK